MLVRLYQGCLWSLILSVLFMDRNSRLSLGEDDVWSRNLRVLCFADDVGVLRSWL